MVRGGNLPVGSPAFGRGGKPGDGSAVQLGIDGDGGGADVDGVIVIAVHANNAVSDIQSIIADLACGNCRSDCHNIDFAG